MIKQKPFQIFSKDADMGIDVVKSPVKLTILEMLRSNDMEFDKLLEILVNQNLQFLYI